MSSQDPLARARQLWQRGHSSQAKVAFAAIVNAQPRHLEALTCLGMIAGQTGAWDEAVAWLTRAAAVDAGNPSLLCNLGLALHGAGRYEAAVSSYDRALAAKPDHAVAFFNRGNALQALGRRDAALASHTQAVRFNDRFHQAFHNRGVLLAELGQLDDAIASYDRALVIKADYVEALYNRGVALQRAGRPREALASYDAALALKGDHAEAYCNSGVVLYGLAQYAAALQRYDAALAVRPDYANAHCNRGTVLYKLGQVEQALEAYRRALSIDPDHVEAHFSCGNALADLREYEASLAHYDRALALGCVEPGLYGSRRQVKMQLCDWRDFAAEAADLTQRIERAELASAPSQVLALADSAALQRRAADHWVGAKHPSRSDARFAPGRAPPERIRVGYFSADYHKHATAHLIARLFELHDRSRFEVIAFSFGPDSKDAMRQRLVRAFDQFHEVRERSDPEVAALARTLGIDIAVDLKGFTQHGRPDIFAHRAAPLQVSFLGYPGTMGAPYMDYLIADRVVIPPHSRMHYRENVVWLPSSYQVNDDTRHIAERSWSRAALGLPEDAMVYCCFNNSYKITPPVFDVWMRILNRVAGSVLWLYQENALATANLRREAAARGIDPSRLVFAGHIDLPEHLARLRAADLVLDTLPYNAHTTASDALWAGVPVLTCVGEAFASRVAASLLTAVGLPGLITADAAEYERRAVTLAGDRAALCGLRAYLRERGHTCALFDTAAYARALEQAFMTMHERQLGGRPPAHIGDAPQPARAPLG